MEGAFVEIKLFKIALPFCVACDAFELIVAVQAGDSTIFPGPAFSDPSMDNRLTFAAGSNAIYRSMIYLKLNCGFVV